MKTRETDNNVLFRRVEIAPWDEPFTAKIAVLQEKRDTATGAKINKVSIDIGGQPLSVATAREWAEAIQVAIKLAGEMEMED